MDESGDISKSGLRKALNTASSANLLVISMSYFYKFWKSKVLPAFGKRDVLIVQSENVLILRAEHVIYKYSKFKINSGVSPRTVRSLLNGGSFLLTHCHQICIRKEISRPGFLDVTRYSVVHSIDLRRVFKYVKRYVNISMCKFGVSVSCPGLYGGLYGYNFKNRMVISGIATSKNHIELLVSGQIWDRIRDPGQILV
jgi:hypothetical protein